MRFYLSTPTSTHDLLEIKLNVTLTLTLNTKLFLLFNSCLFILTFHYREKLVIYNKFDLSNPQLKKPLLQALKEYRNETNVLFTKADTCVNVQSILDFCVQKCNDDPVRFPYLSIAVVGAPNVGKSTLINGLRRLGMGMGKVTQTGKKAGVTTAIQTRVKIHKDPPIYLFDTPGIFNPHFTSPIEGLKIALTGATNDKLASISNVADYLLFRLNNCPTGKKRKTWPKVVGLEEASDDIYYVATHIAKMNHFVLNASNRMVRLSPDFKIDRHDEVYWDIDRACQYMVDLYRLGRFGRMTLDDLGPNAIKEFFEGAKEIEMTKTGYQILPK